MKNIRNPLLQTVLIVLLAANVAVRAENLNAYFVGNSLTDLVRLETGLRGLVQETGNGFNPDHSSRNEFAHIVAGANLYWHWYHGGNNQDPPVTYYIDDFGPELRSNTWDVLVLQAYRGSKLYYVNSSALDPTWEYWEPRPREEGDVPMCSNFIDQVVYQGATGTNLQVYIYSQWPEVPDTNGSPDYANFDYKIVWDTAYTGGKPSSRDYWQKLHDEVSAQWNGRLGKEVLLVPVGDVLYELNERLRASPLEGFRGNPVTNDEVAATFDDMEDIYHDGNHLAMGVGSYLKALTFLSVLYRQDPRGLSTGHYNELTLYYGVYQPGFIRVTAEWQTLLQEVVWQVAATHFRAGIRETLRPGDANLDGAVNSTDHDLLTAAWGRTDVDINATGIGWRAGDFDGDGDVDQDDLNIYQANADAADPALQLPFSETFDGLTPGYLNGQHGWSGGAGATVVSGTAYSGTQALSVAETDAGHVFQNGSNRVAVSFWTIPVTASSPPALDTNAAAQFWFNSSGNLVVYSNTTAVTLSATAVSNDWNKIEVELNYVSNVWKIALNGTNAAQNLGFYSARSTFSGIVIRQSSLENAFLDDLNISNITVGSVSALDNWLVAHYGHTNVNTGAFASNGVNTIMETYIAGLNPNDPSARFELSGVHPLTWNAVSGRVYTIYWTSNLLNGFQTLETNWAGGSFTDTLHSAGEQGFYRIEVRTE